MDGSRTSSVSFERSALDANMATAQQPRAPAPIPAKKTKGKKPVDPNDASKQIAAKIAQLEQDAAGDKEQEAEIEREVKKATRDMNHLLSKIETDHAKLETVLKKHQDLLHEMKRTEREHIKSKKKADQLQKDKDGQRSELNKAVAGKDRMDKLARDLAKENKKLKEELDRIRATETTMRNDLHDRVHRMVIDVEDVIRSKEEPEPPAFDLEIDELFRQKFKSFIDQYEMREIQFASLLRTKDLEVEFLKAKFERQRKAQEMESTKSHQLTRQVSTFSQTESELRTQLNIYVEKFKQVEETLNNSNDLFLTFRKEMEEMSKKTKRLEKENRTLTRKQEAASRSILDMAEERSKRQEEMDKLRKRSDHLEKLCRGMQAQGRGQMNVPDIDEDVGTESEYEEGEDDEDYGSEDYDDETEEEGSLVEPRPKTYGPPPPPPPSQVQTQALRNGKPNGLPGKPAKQVNGIKH